MTYDVCYICVNDQRSICPLFAINKHFPVVTFGTMVPISIVCALVAQSMVWSRLTSFFTVCGLSIGHPLSMLCPVVTYYLWFVQWSRILCGLSRGHALAVVCPVVTHSLWFVPWSHTSCGLSSGHALSVICPVIAARCGLSSGHALAVVCPVGTH